MFSPFERAVAFRYLRARKGERFVSVTAAYPVWWAMRLVA